jgi:hypothetical protein
MIHRKIFWFRIADLAVSQGRLTRQQADDSAMRQLRNEYDGLCALIDSALACSDRSQTPIPRSE